ncbi:extracellular solute-binding protein [Dolosicoccus paucivorans]|uniref:extracellular solute-binding protein n=1 Tax=Dolosicoccus paucivorans TaxID=84521 RepID=UPI000881CD73|nr:extracellular solute-binding protein [Dolosicoccus paucivorans]SDI65045.1 iron(III) transport system substrate-binding protein [Dolosicoccus paucivorans]
MKQKMIRLMAAMMVIATIITSVTPLRVFAEGKELLVYSNSLTDERKEWLTQKSSEAGFNLTYVDAGGGDLFNRLLAEKSAPQADVVFGLDESMFMELQDNDLLVAYEPTWADKVDEAAKVGDGYFFPIVEQRIFMTYNPEFITEEEAPKNWQDLAATEDFHGKYNVPANFQGGTSQKALLSILLQYVEEAGELGISDEGWQQAEAYLENGYQTPESENQHANFKDGKVPLSFIYSSGVPLNEEEFEMTIQPINPEQGVVTMREQVGIINKGDEDYSVAQEFVDWFGSGEVQGEWAAEFGSLPLNEEAFDKVQPRLKEIAEQTTPMDIDWDFVREHLSEWIEKAELELMP